MSSESDEDELLQMALHEQSTGKKPSEPPPKQNPTRGVAATPNRKLPAKHRKGASEVDEYDSDLEILSISSGEEDHASSKKDTKGPAKKRAPRGAGKDDDELWQGGEPDCWKRVDEDELRRHVRDMREARAIPATQIKAEEEKMALAKKALQSLQSFPRGMECIDPLRLGIVDNRTLRMISEHSTSSPTVGDLDPKTRDRLNYFSEKFDSKLFLSRIHQDTSAADLEAGSVSLKTDLKGRMQQKKQLVKENFDCFVSCKTTIDDIESKLRRIEEDPEGSGTKHLYDCMQGVNSIANRAFESLFERQAQAEKIRSVQGMLQRFRTLFNLPSTIRESISKGEYDLAVREYRKANSIVLPSHVGILKRVVGEVEKVMQEFKGMLYKSLEDPNIDLTNLENIVRLLLELEPESDPVWHYLNIQENAGYDVKETSSLPKNDWHFIFPFKTAVSLFMDANHRIRGLLEKCSLDHEARMENLLNEMRARALYDAKWRQIQQNLNHSSDIDYSASLGNSNLSGDSETLVMTGEQGDAFRGKYIRRLIAVVIHHVPAFWKVSVSVFSGKFAKASQVSSDSNVNVSAKRTEEKVGDGKYSSHSLDEVAGMLQSTLSAYGSEVQNTFRDLEESNILCPCMSDAIKEISKACRTFEAKESAPPVAVTALRTLQSEVTKIYILRLCSWMRTTTEKITQDETWIPVSILERNRSPYTISSLPLTFRSIITFAMDQINTMIQSLRNEAMKFENIFLLLQEIQESIRLAFLNCLLNFAGQLGHTGNQLLSEYDREGSHFQHGHAEPEEKSLDPLPGSIVNPHRQLLMVVSNIGFLKDELSHELNRKYRQTWLQSRGKDEEDGDMQDLITSFSGLEENVLEQYTLAKRNLFRTAAVNYLLESGVQWGAAPAVKGVRDAAVDLLHTLVAVHAEVFAGCKPLLDKTLGILVEGLIDTFLSLFHENQETDFAVLDVNGFCQLMLELDYFETILTTYFTHEARESLKTLQGVLLEKATESVPETIETPSHSRRSTRGNDDVLQDERQQGGTVSPDDLIALAQQYSSELLQSELERTRINTACFVESIALDSVPDSAKAAYASFRGSMDSPSRGSQSIGPPSYSKQRRR